MSAETLCARCATPLERDDLRCPICALAAPPREDDIAEPVVQILRCEGCGSAITYDEQREQAGCAFCGASVRIEEPEDPVEQAEAYLPFTVSPSEASQSLRTWLKNLGWFHPRDLVREARVDSLKALWWAGFAVDVEAEVSWACDSNARSKKAPWAPHAGHTELRLDDFLISASQGLQLDEVQALAGRYKLEAAEANARGPQGAQIERFDFQRSAARARIQKALREHASEHLKRRVIPGNTFRKLGLSIVLEGLSTRRLGLPAYVFAYRYRRRLYRVVVHGQDETTVIGTAPLSWPKVFLFVSALLAVLIAGLGWFVQSW